MKNNRQNLATTNASNRLDQGSHKDLDYFASMLIETSDEEASDKIFKTVPDRFDEQLNLKDSNSRSLATLVHDNVSV